MSKSNNHQTGNGQVNPGTGSHDADARENLSAGIDGELSKEAMRFLLCRLDHDASLQQTWSHYNLARDGLRRQLPAMASSDFAARVMAAIEQEALPLGNGRSRWLRWSVGGAIAASVAAAALMVGQPTADVDRNVASVGQRPAADVALASAPAVSGYRKAATNPANVPSWLSGNTFGVLSEQASATLGAPVEGSGSYADKRRLSSYPLMHRYRTLNNDDGSYLLLLDPQQQPVSSSGSPNPPRQAASAVH